MPNAGKTLKQFYDAVTARDMAKARTYLRDDFVFVGLFETYRSADDYIAALAGLLQVTVRLKVKTVIAENDQAAIFFELETKAPAEGIVLVAEWHRIESGKIAHVESAFDGRPYAVMFTGADRSRTAGSLFGPSAGPAAHLANYSRMARDEFAAIGRISSRSSFATTSARFERFVGGCCGERMDTDGIAVAIENHNFPYTLTAQPPRRQPC